MHNLEVSITKNVFINFKKPKKCCSLAAKYLLQIYKEFSNIFAQTVYDSVSCSTGFGNTKTNNMVESTKEDQTTALLPIRVNVTK